MLLDWKTWLGLVFGLLPIVLRFLPITGPLMVAALKTRIGRTLAAVAIVAGALFIGAAWFEDRGFDRGAQKTQERIEQQNTKAIGKARAAAQTVDECYDRDGEWDQSTGRCSK